MNRSQRIWNRGALIGFVLMVPIGAQALGLGEARVESFLNQPLDVRMRLLDATEDNLDSLTVAPASPADYERLGLMAESLSLRLDIRIDRSVSPPVVRVTSERPVTDPVVQLLVDARWANGRVLREYTLFLDPATVEVAAPAPAPATTSTSAEPEPESAARSGTDRRPRPTSGTAGSRSAASDRQPQPVARSRSGSYGPVESGDTLWSIARASLPAGGVTMDQMMIAILELNPRAFRDGNINQLLRGAALEMPDAAQAAALDAATAAAEVAAQNRAFRARTRSETPTVSSAGRNAGQAAGEDPAQDAEPGDGARRPAGQDAAAGDEAPDHRLSLVPPGDEQSGGGLSDREAAEIADLQQRLARAEEELYAARQEAEEFQSRVEELEALVRDNPGGFGLRDAELAGLEETLRAARQATREDADPAMRSRVSRRLDEYIDQYAEASSGNGDGDDSETDGAPAGDAAAGEAASSPGGAGSPAAREAQPDAEDEAASEPAVTRTERSDGLFENPILLLVIGLVVVLLALAAVRIGLRRRAAADTSASAAPSPTPINRTDTPLERARAQVTSRPTDLAAHLGLLQTLASEENQARFGQALEAMFEHVDSGNETEWREALELAGRVVPGHSLVKGSSDWVSDDDQEAAEPASELDEESEVDDLMSRLDADLDESDDLDWLGEEEPRSTTPDGPLLREDEDSPPTESSGQDDTSFRFTGTEVLDTSDLDEDSSADPGWGDEREEAVSDRDSGADEGDADADVDELSLDWDSAEDGREGGAAPATDDGEPEDSQGAGTEDDIFAQSDDDIDVKLDLAKAYLSWDSMDSARTLLEEVMREGNDAQREAARKLLDETGDGGED